MTTPSVDPLDEHLLARVDAIVAAQWSKARAVRAEPLRGGQSSITQLVHVIDAPVDRVVVKVAPPGLAPVANRDVLRHARALDAVASLPGVPVPAVLGRDPGSPPEVPPLFVMEHVAGDHCEPAMDREVRVPRADVTARAQSAARMLAALHTASVEALGLGDEPVVELAHEVQRWARALETVPAELRPGALELADGLAARVPDATEAVLVHGDWRLGNMLAVGPTIRSVIDWEIWSRSDPRLDVAWFLIGADAAHVAAVRAPASVGVPEADVLRRDYAGAGGRIGELEWFEALVRLKLAAVWGLIAKRALARDRPRSVGARFASWIPRVVTRGAELLADYQRLC